MIILTLKQTREVLIDPNKKNLTHYKMLLFLYLKGGLFYDIVK